MPYQNIHYAYEIANSANFNNIRENIQYLYGEYEEITQKNTDQYAWHVSVERPRQVQLQTDLNDLENAYSTNKVLEDGFDRDVTDGWGSSTDITWETAEGDPSAFSVTTGGDALVTLSNTQHHSQRVVDGALKNVQVRAEFAISEMASGDWIIPAVHVRKRDESNFYAARLNFRQDGTVLLSVYSGNTLLASHTLGSYTTDEFWNVDFKVVSDSIQARAWKTGDATPEWQIDLTDSSNLTAGEIEAHNNIGGSYDGSYPVIIRWDNFDYQVPPPPLLGGKWEIPPSQEIPERAVQYPSWPVELVNNGGVSRDSDQTSFTVNEPGVWAFDFTMMISGQNNGGFYACWIVDANNKPEGWAKQEGTDWEEFQLTMVKHMNAGDSVTLAIFVDTGTNGRSTTHNNMNPTFHAVRLGPG